MSEPAPRRGSQRWGAPGLPRTAGAGEIPERAGVLSEDLARFGCGPGRR